MLLCCTTRVYREVNPFTEFSLMDHLEAYSELKRRINSDLTLSLEAVESHKDAAIYTWGRYDPLSLPKAIGTLEDCRRVARYYESFIAQLSDAEQVTLALLDESRVEGAND